jgi:hypothetical protein
MSCNRLATILPTSHRPSAAATARTSRSCRSTKWSIASRPRSAGAATRRLSSWRERTLSPTREWQRALRAPRRTLPPALICCFRVYLVTLIARMSAACLISKFCMAPCVLHEFRCDNSDRPVEHRALCIHISWLHLLIVMRVSNFHLSFACSPDFFLFLFHSCLSNRRRPSCFPEAFTTLAQYREFCAAIGPSVPVLANITEFGQTPLFNCDELAAHVCSFVLSDFVSFCSGVCYIFVRVVN